jgi:hypothetical protein
MYADDQRRVRGIRVLQVRAGATSTGQAIVVGHQHGSLGIDAFVDLIVRLVDQRDDRVARARAQRCGARPCAEYAAGWDGDPLAHNGRGVVGQRERGTRS